MAVALTPTTQSGTQRDPVGVLKGPGRSRSRWVHDWLPIALLAGVAALLHAVSLLRSRPPLVDEVWNLNRAWGLIQTGRPFGTLDAGVLDRFDGHWTYFPMLGTWFHAMAIQLLGFGVFSVRAVSLLFGLVLLATVYFIGSRLYCRRVGVLAAVVTALTGAFLSASLLGRHDMIVAAFGFAAVALHLADRAPGLPIRSVLAGLAVSLTLDIHPIGAMYAPTIFALHLLEDGRSVLRSRRFWGFSAGLGIGGALFLAMHVLPYPRTFLALGTVAFGSARVPPALVLDARIWAQSALETLDFLFMSGYLLTPLFLIAFAGLSTRRTAPDRKVLVLCAGLALALTALVRYKSNLYGVLLMPACGLLTAAFLDRLLQAWREGAVSPTLPRRLSLGLLAAVVIGLTVSAPAHTLGTVLDRPVNDYEAVAQHLRQSVPPNNLVMGSQSHWLGFTDERYLSWEQLVYHQRYASGSSLEDAFRALRPDFFIIDRHIEQFVAAAAAQLPEHLRYLYISETELLSFLDRHGRMVASMESAAFGKVRVYRIDWN